MFCGVFHEHSDSNKRIAEAPVSELLGSGKHSKHSLPLVTKLDPKVDPFIPRVLYENRKISRNLNPEAVVFYPNVSSNSCSNPDSDILSHNPPFEDTERNVLPNENVRSGDGNVYSSLNNLRINNINNIIVAHLNINSLRNKIEILSDIMEGKIDILLISETKLDDTFPSSSFKIAGYPPPV